MSRKLGADVITFLQFFVRFSAKTCGNFRRSIKEEEEVGFSAKIICHFHEKQRYIQYVK
jgi:protoheme ferro-lyase